MPLFMQGLKPLVSTELPTPIFETPTKVASESPAAVSYLGKNKVPELQKLFQVETKNLYYTMFYPHFTLSFLSLIFLDYSGMTFNCSYGGLMW